jgi:tetratricopeptide (TPR) repeat protein
LDLIAGLPLEGYDDFEKSFHDVYNLKPDQLQLGFLKILKGSLMEMECKTYGIAYRNTAPYEVLFTNSLSYEELLKIKGACEMVEIYYNSGQFTYAICYLEHFYNSPLKLFQEINEYYENKNIALQAHSRIKRYEILLDFYKEKVANTIKEKEAVSIALFQEILVLDLFLREDMKSRPSFAPVHARQYNLRELYEKHRGSRSAIHIEQFTFDVLISSKSGQPVRKDTVLLFDYNDRDPLNKAAKRTLIRE